MKKSLKIKQRSLKSNSKPTGQLRIDFYANTITSYISKREAILKEEGK